MSKEDHTCKHKERKPKKPHYIPRPWGKPYNYKCFQCPFTCMEKSHLYNHMKYSLCKNSLSLLIESDWPYKKDMEEEGESPGGEEEEESGQGLLRAHSMENQLKHYKLSKTFLTAPDLLSEQWRLLATSHTMAEGTQPRVSDSIPCYPPPPGLVDYQDPTELNRSILGVGYPLSPSLFSYMNSMNLAQLPFLASAAQLLHPASGVHHPINRTLLPSSFYYPFFCEHAFGAASTKSDVNKVLKTSANGQVPPPPHPLQHHQTLPTGQGTSSRLQPRRGNQDGASREQEPSWGPTSPLQRRGQPSGSPWIYSRTFRTPYPSPWQQKSSSSTAEDLIAQGHLWEHLNKIRSELSHIHHALERTACQTEGPLDLSIKKEQPVVTEVVAASYQGLMGASLKDDITTETEEDDEEAEEEEAEEEEDENEMRKEAMKASLERRKQSLDVLIKMSQAGVQVVKTEVLSPGGLGLRPSKAECLWPGRTTKCEADSSVLLCTDGRPLTVFTDFPPSSNKNSKKPLSIQRLGVPQCPPSPLTATDS
uniref:Proline rich 35 n=1 Tax=Oncorhynchus kisutch TaxID=8019 RepID=A0A8C7DP33_ONCKI